MKWIRRRHRTRRRCRCCRRRGRRCHWGKINKIVSAVSNAIFSFILIRFKSLNMHEIRTTCNDCVEKFAIAMCLHASSNHCHHRHCRRRKEKETKEDRACE